MAEELGLPRAPRARRRARARVRLRDRPPAVRAAARDRVAPRSGPSCSPARPGLAAPLFGESGLVEAPGDRRGVVRDAARPLLARGQRRRPRSRRCCSIDDLHWGDAPSLRWLDHMVPPARRPAALLVASPRGRPSRASTAALLTELLIDPARRRPAARARSGSSRCRSSPPTSSWPSPTRPSARRATRRRAATRSTCARC